MLTFRSIHLVDVAYLDDDLQLLHQILLTFHLAFNLMLFDVHVIDVLLKNGLFFFSLVSEVTL